MARVTYLLGAGASAGSLPTVDKFETEIADAINYISGLTMQSFGNLVPAPAGWTVVQKLKHLIVNDLSMLLDGCRKHRSVDTYAKRLFLTKGEDDQMYRNTKCALILFFELYRFMHNKTDKRYDAFLATILGRGEERFPKDINILSWNYDYEFERAYMNYVSHDKGIHDAYSDMNILHKNSKSGKPLADNFGIIKLNGTIGFYDEYGQLYLGLTAKCEYNYINYDAHELYNLLNAYAELSRSENGKYLYTPAISFAWEDDYGIVNVKDEILNVLANTDKIIVIGYSFPYFNRGIDNHIMWAFKKYAKGKVYIQAPSSAINEIVDNVKELRTSWQDTGYIEQGKQRPETVFIPKTGLDQFYMSF